MRLNPDWAVLGLSLLDPVRSGARGSMPVQPRIILGSNMTKNKAHMHPGTKIGAMYEVGQQ